MKTGFSIGQIKDIGQAGKREVYTNSIAKWTLGYGKWAPRLISPYITWAILTIIPGISPNIISYSMLLVCVAAEIILLKGFFILGGILLYLSIILDKVDGEVARLKAAYSSRGIFLDLQYHYVYWLCFFFMGLGIYLREGNVCYLMLSIVNSFLGTHLRYTEVNYQKIMFKINPDIRDVKEIEFIDIANPIFVKMVTFLEQINRQDMVAIVLVICAVIGFQYPVALTFFMWFYLVVLAINSLILFTCSFVKAESSNVR